MLLRMRVQGGQSPTEDTKTHGAVALDNGVTVNVTCLVLLQQLLRGVGHASRIVLYREGMLRPFGSHETPVLRQPCTQRVRQVLIRHIVSGSAAQKGLQPDAMPSMSRSKEAGFRSWQYSPYL